MCIGLCAKYPSFLSDFKWNLNSLDRFSKKSTNLKFNENLSIGSRVLFCVRTDIAKLIVDFSQFTN